MNIAILFDVNVLLYHHGVRNLMLSIYINLLDVANVELLLVGKNIPIRRLRLEQKTINNNFFTDEWIVGRSRTEILNSLNPSLFRKIASPANVSFDFNELEIFNEKLFFDTTIISGPWIISKNITLPKSKFFKMVAHDTIPIQYYFEKPNNENVYSFAMEHHRGYKWVTDEITRSFLCNSQSTYDNLKLLGYIDSPKKASVLPILFPPGFKDIKKNELIFEKRQNSVVLAAPFDRRKGLEYMAEILNGTGVSKLIIFGNIRCDANYVKEFFGKLEIDDVTWYINIGFETKKKIYLQSQVLLFPSLNEGLGLPLIEAYAAGCRSLTFEKTSSLAAAEDKMNNLADFRMALQEAELSKHDPMIYRSFIECICSKGKIEL